MSTRLSEGDIAPAFTLPDDHGENVSLSDFAGNRVVVYFYPAAMTPGCTTQAVDFTAAAGDFETAGITVIGISPDPVAKLASFREKADIAFPLLSDPDHLALDPYGAWGERMLYGKNVTGVIRSTFVIDVAADGVGTIASAQYNVKATGHVDRLRRDLKI